MRFVLEKFLCLNFLKKRRKTKMIKKPRRKNAKSKKLTAKELLRRRNYIKEQEYINFFQSDEPLEKLQKQIFCYYRKCSTFLTDPLSYIPKTTKDPFEYNYMEKAIKILGALTKPHLLADFLDIDVDIVLDAVETGIIPCISCNNLYSIKTKEIFPFLSIIKPHQRIKHEH